MKMLEYPEYEPCGSMPLAGHWTMVKALTCEIPKGHAGDFCGAVLAARLVTWPKPKDLEPVTLTPAPRQKGPRRHGR